MIFTFWEGRLPAYVELCLATWKKPFEVLNYNNLHKYTDLKIEPLKRFTLPQIADCVRVHVLRDHGGQWLDADTIMITDRLPEKTMVGDPVKRTCSIGVLNAEPGAEMFKKWASYQDSIINGRETSKLWSVMGNSFTDPYLRNHPEITVHNIEAFYPELYMIPDKMSRGGKYVEFYFKKNFYLKDIRPADLLMLHNSWTPGWYKDLNKLEVLNCNCTLSNILRETV